MGQQSAVGRTSDFGRRPVDALHSYARLTVAERSVSEAPRAAKVPQSLTARADASSSRCAHFICCSLATSLLDIARPPLHLTRPWRR